MRMAAAALSGYALGFELQTCHWDQEQKKQPLRVGAPGVHSQIVVCVVIVAIRLGFAAVSVQVAIKVEVVACEMENPSEYSSNRNETWSGRRPPPPTEFATCTFAMPGSGIPSPASGCNETGTSS